MDEQQFNVLKERLETLSKRLATAQAVTNERLRSKNKIHKALLEAIEDFAEHHERKGTESINKIQTIISASDGLLFLTKRSLKAYEQTLAVIDHEKHFAFIQEIFSNMPELNQNAELKPVTTQYYNIMSLAQVIRKHLMIIIPLAEQQTREAEAFGNDMALMNLHVYLKVSETLQRAINDLEKDLKPIIYAIKTSMKELSRLPDRLLHLAHNKNIQIAIAAGLILPIVTGPILSMLGVDGEHILEMGSELTHTVHSMHIVEAATVLVVGVKSIAK